MRQSSVVRSALAILMLGLLALPAASRAQVDLTKKPTPGPAPKAVFPPFSEVKLKNGLRVVLVEDHRQPVVYFRTLILSGGAVDGGHVGTAAAVSYMLQKGTTTRSADDIAKKVDFYGAQIAAGANSDGLNIFVSILKKDLNEVLPVYSDVILHPNFPKAELDKYISQRAAALKSDKQNPAYSGGMLGRKLAFGDHPYGSVETEVTNAALTPELLAQWHAKNFCANNTIIAVDGDVTKDEIVPMLEKYFGTWASGTPAVPQFTELHDIKGTPIYLIDRPGSVQSTIRLERLGLPRGDDAFDKASFLAAIFCGNGSMGSANRLYQNIREKHGYTYTPVGSLTSSVDRGLLVAIAEVRNAVTDSALDQMLIEYRRLATEEVPVDELRLAKSMVTGGFLMSLADPSTTSANVLAIMEYGLPKDYYQTYANHINALSSAELKAVGARYFSPNDIAIIVTGDASVIKSKLERFGDVKVFDVDLNPAGMQEYAASDLSLDAVVDKFYAALGKPAMEKIQDRTTEADVQISINGQEVPGKLTTIEAAPNMKYERLTLAFGVMQNWVDGKHVWQQQGTQSAELQGDDLQRELSGAEFDVELQLKNPANKLSLLGMTKMKNNDEAYVLQFEKLHSAPEKWYISKTSGLLVQRDVSQAGVTNSTIYSDFKAVDGVTLPFGVAISGAQDLTITITSIKQNTHPDPSVFTKKS